MLTKHWGDFLSKWTTALAAVKPHTRILWSPAAPESPRRTANTSDLYAANLTASLQAISNAAPLLTDIVIQDSVGKASNASTPGVIHYPVGCLDASWHALTARSALRNVSVGINMEMFLRKGRRVPASAIVDLPANPMEMRAREGCYAEQGLTLGPSWEASFWLHDLTQIWEQ